MKNLTIITAMFHALVHVTALPDRALRAHGAQLRPVPDRSIRRPVRRRVGATECSPRRER